jgi:hypothetical protein
MFHDIEDGVMSLVPVQDIARWTALACQINSQSANVDEA